MKQDVTPSDPATLNDSTHPCCACAALQHTRADPAVSPVKNACLGNRTQRPKCLFRCFRRVFFLTRVVLHVLSHRLRSVDLTCPKSSWRQHRRERIRTLNFIVFHQSRVRVVPRERAVVDGGTDSKDLHDSNVTIARWKVFISNHQIFDDGVPAFSA